MRVVTRPIRRPAALRSGPDRALIWRSGRRADRAATGLDRRSALMAIATTNPATGEVLTTFEPLTDAEIDTRLEAAAQGFRTLRRTSFADRAGWMRAAADIL